MTEQKYTLENNSCNCHPETCNCNDYAIYEDGKKFISVFYKQRGRHIVKALNFYEENKDLIKK